MIELTKNTYTLPEAAKILGTSEYKLRQARKTGKFKMMGNDVPKSSIMDWLGIGPRVSEPKEPVDYKKLARQQIREELELERIGIEAKLQELDRLEGRLVFTERRRRSA